VSFHFGLPGGAAQARQGSRRHRDRIGDDRKGSDLARGARAMPSSRRRRSRRHRGMFLTDNIAEQPGTFALVRRWSMPSKFP